MSNLIDNIANFSLRSTLKEQQSINFSYLLQSEVVEQQVQQSEQGFFDDLKALIQKIYRR